MGNLNSSNMELNVTKSCKQTALLLLTADGSVPLKKGNTLFNAGFVLPTVPKLTWGSYRLTENFGNSGWKVNGMVTFRKFQPKIEEYVLR